ncbi:AMP-binding protein [Halopenitus sp. H-Gu1]|uniref:class I adenylate-forming enzyme family protein n=1 Tax=Halopenitus sp. H-Gu1 TaxID=3242697 RepID=UPI00359E3FAF
MRDWLSHRVAATPNATALVRAADGESWSYADLDRLVGETAGRLAALDVDRTTRLGIHLSPCVGYVGLVHAAMRLGATLVPIGHDLTPREIAARTERADPDVVVCGSETEVTAFEALGNSSVRVLSVDEPDHDDVIAIHDADPKPVEEPTWTLEEPLCLLFTSGTSGQPKPVEITAENVFFSAIASAFRLGVRPDDCWLVTLPLHHAGGLSPVFRTVLYGTTLVLREEFAPGEAADDIDQYDVTGVSLVPTMLTRMLDSRGTLSDSLRTVLLGGAPASDQLLKRCENYSIPVYPTYGMTETASQIATATPEEAFDHLGTVGRPLLWNDLSVVDDTGNPVEPGDVGEIVVSGPTVTPRYYDQPESTAEAFGPLGFHTGDAGRIDTDGYVYVLNRLDDRIITGGENVEPGEVADVLHSHPAVLDVAVAGVPDEMWGERVGALIVPDDDRNAPNGDGQEVDGSADGNGSSSDGDVVDSESEKTDTDSESDDRSPIDEHDLLEHARSQLSAFKMPRAIAYQDELPRTVSGTVDREAARATLIEEGTSIEVPEFDFDEAGFEPADPEPAPDSDASDDRNEDVDADDRNEDVDADPETGRGADEERENSGGYADS